MGSRMEVISSNFYSNCLIESIKAKIKDPKNVKITIVPPWYNEVFCFHAMWTDGVNDYDFGSEGMGDSFIGNWTVHKGHVRRYKLGSNDRYVRICKKRYHLRKERRRNKNK